MSASANPLVDQFRKGGVPRDLRLMAAQGVLPLKPTDLIELLHLLLADEDAEVKASAAATMGGLPADELLPILKDKQTPGGILAWGLTRPERELREVVLQNTSTPDEAIENVVPNLPEELAELVVINQVRLLRRTSLLEAVESNPNLSRDQQRRLRELREEFKIGAEPEAPPPAPIPEPVVAAPEPPPVVDAPAAVEEEPSLTEEEALARLGDDERKDPVKLSAVQKLYKLNTSQKVVQALKGTREERTILIRDPNRLVYSAVLGSPRLTDAEVESIASMKNISSEVLRAVANNKEWIKKYTILSGLVKNPRTPLGVSMGMVTRLNPRDLKAISVDRNVSEAVRKAAQRFVKAKEQGGTEN